jgi:hypothetical protein
MEMGYREYARHRGVSLGAVQKAIRDKRISLNGNGKIDPETADRDWAANTDASRVAVNVLAASPLPMQQAIDLALATEPAAHAGEKPDSDEITGTDRAASEYREHRATRERYQALRQQLEYEQLVGQLINVDEASRIVFTSFRAMRDSLMNVSARIKDQLAAQTDPHLCEQLIEAEISAALASIDVRKLLKDQSDTED